MSEHEAPAVTAHDAEHADHAHHPQIKYHYIFYALVVLTIVSWAADKVGAHSSKMAVGLVVLTVACLKAMFVMLYFMHLKFEGRWKFVLLAPTMILALAIIAALSPDVGFHYYDQQVPQNSVPAPHAGAHAGEQPPAAGAATEQHH